jgi:hypothetical protein
VLFFRADLVEKFAYGRGPGSVKLAREVGAPARSRRAGRHRNHF